MSKRSLNRIIKRKQCLEPPCNKAEVMEKLVEDTTYSL